MRTLEAACKAGFVPVMRTCQDLYGLLIAHHYHLGKYGQSRAYLNDYNRMSYLGRGVVPVLSADNDVTCPDDMLSSHSIDNDGSAVVVSLPCFTDPSLIHRQLPGVRAHPWWNTSTETTLPAIYSFLSDIQSQYQAIRDEVNAVTANAHLKLWGMNQDLRLSTNAEWDPLTAWEAIALHAKGKWIEDSCTHLPVTCGVLKAHDQALNVVFDTDNKYNELVGKPRIDRDYVEKPTLGIKLYRVWPNAGIKNHTGSPGRLVHSLTLVGPTDPYSTLTVGDTTRQWQEGEILSFDDSYFHAVDNPHSTVHRVVLAIVTLHPDLLSEDLSSSSNKNEL
jgi:hypothetical protein